MEKSLPLLVTLSEEPTEDIDLSSVADIIDTALEDLQAFQLQTPRKLPQISFEFQTGMIPIWFSKLR